MAEELHIPLTTQRKKLYESLLPQIEALVAEEENLVANLANIAAALKQAFNFFWVGFYLEKRGELILGPFQGPIACTRIPFHKGVCGHAYTLKETTIVPDVELFPGHIACSSNSKSEIVLIVKNRHDAAIGVLDIDSDRLNDFDTTDQQYLEILLDRLKQYF
ncbi:MAG: GAF domain-containing protein [Leadbetterella sp.]